MVFINSLKLFRSNWLKVLKFLLYYIVVWGICFALFLPVFFEFRGLVSANFSAADVEFFGVFSGGIGANIQNFFSTSINTLFDIFSANVGMAIYGFLVVFVFLPFLINIGKYALSSTLYYYMTSNNETGFLSALIKSLKKSVPFAIAKTVYNLVFFTLLGLVIYGLTAIGNTTYVRYCLWLVVFVAVSLFFALQQVTILGWIPALIVFDCNIFKAYQKGMKAAGRHFGKTYATSLAFFLIFWAFIMVFGAYVLAVFVPLMASLLCVYDMTEFFTSQGMRFYINSNKILTPKKLEEVDNINKTAFIL